MHPALLKLLRMRIVAWGRRFVSRGSLLRRIIGGLFAGYILISWIASFFFLALSDRRPPTDPAVVLQFGPLVLALFIALRLAGALTSRALEFTPAEMDFLFPAPFTRRQLLVYKLGLGSLGGLFLSLILSGRLMHLGASWLSAFVALFLAFLFTQLAGVLASLARQRVGQGTYGRVTLVLAAGVLLAGAFAALPSIREAGAADVGAIVRGIAERAHQSTIARAALWPFEVFVRVLVSPPGPALAGWTAAALGLLAALLLGIFRLDVLYAEAAVAASARSAARLDRAKRSGTGLVARSAAIRIPALPRLAGVGPIAWRQLVGAARAWPSVLVLFVVLVALLAGARWLVGAENAGAASAFGLAFPLYIIFSSLIRFDFRGDIDHIDTLKSLPIRPWAVALGQLTAPALITASTIVLVGVFLAVFLPGGARVGNLWLPVACFLCALPAAILICAIENVVFLLFPTRMTAGSAGDTNTMLRHTATAILKLMLLAGAGGTFAGVWALVWFTTESVAATIAALWLAACTLALVGVWLLAFSFRRFDPSRDMPA